MSMESHSGIRLRAPVFEIGLKGYAYGAEAVRLARAADRLGQELGVTIIFDPQCVDIPAVARETAAGIPGAELVVIAQCGHISTLEQPDRVNAAMLNWLQA